MPRPLIDARLAVRQSAVLMAVLLAISMPPTFATVRIYDDGGGQIGQYLAKFRALRASGDDIVIDGRCASACTMILGLVPRSRICVTPRAVLEFHAAWDPTPAGTQVSRPGTAYLWASYPPAVRRWINRNGGLRSESIFLRGPELEALYPSCR